MIVDIPMGGGTAGWMFCNIFIFQEIYTRESWVHNTVAVHGAMCCEISVNTLIEQYQRPVSEIIFQKELIHC